MDRRTSLGLLNFAASYMRAAEHLVSEIEHGRLKLRFHDPVEFLAGHAVELALKAFLRARGLADDELQRLGHDLEELMNEAKRLGLTVEVTEQESRHVLLLNARYGYSPYRVRYLETGAYDAHDDRVVLAFARRVEAAIRPAIEAAYVP
jgi:HEPN domain-containing protein